jgi:2-aminoadipate transaminase
MSYKLDLSGLKRDSDTSLTQQLVDLFVGAIEDAELEPGEKLPTTRALAADAGVNHLTAARVYRRLAELGYVTAQVGRGTFVRSLVPDADELHGDDWQAYVLPERTRSYAEQVLDEAFRLADQPGMISFSTGWPNEDQLPHAELARIAADVFAEEGARAINYSATEGLPILREQIAARGRKSGFAQSADEIVVTSGARQAIDIAARALIEPGDVVVTESPTFIGSLSSLRQAGARVIGVPVDADGFDVVALEQVLARHEVKLCSLQTSCQNPTGRHLSQERKERLARLARERNFFVLEDGVYGDLRFDGRPHRRLRELAPGHVIYIDSLSKTVGGGLRIGWLAARGPVLERLAMLKLGADFHSSTLDQHIAARYLASGGYEQLIERAIPFYKERSEVLLDALARHMPGEYRVDPPQGGHHAWVTLTRNFDDRSLYEAAVRHGVTFTPGLAVTADRTSQTKLRLSFSLLSPEQLNEGVKRLARALRELGRQRTESQSRAIPLS